MIEDVNVLLMAGGRYKCTPEWDEAAEEWDYCYKMYIPVSGDARILHDGQWRKIEAGNLYIFSSVGLERYQCPDKMEVIWVHFMPKSLRMRYKLDRAKPFTSWRMPETPFRLEHMAFIPNLFDNPRSRKTHLRADHPDPDTCRLQSIILYFLSDMLKHLDSTAHTELDAQYKRLEPSITFMNAHYLEAPSLKLVSQQADFCPNYFLRVFKRLFGVTPHVYMQRRRLDEARQMLATTASPIRIIALRLCYDNEFYFSRTFKKHVGMSPSQFRKTEGRA